MENLDKNERGILNKLLQFLDSNNSPNDVIFIATTNYIEDALIRDGRFDLKIELKELEKEDVYKFCSSFDLITDESTEIINEYDSSRKNDSTTYNQSQIQNLILSKLGTKRNFGLNSK